MSEPEDDDQREDDQELDSEYELFEFAVELDAIWATRIEGGDIRVYLNPEDVLTFHPDAAKALYNAIGKVLFEADGN